MTAAGGLTDPCCICYNTLDYWHRTVGLDRHDEPCDDCTSEDRKKRGSVL